MHPAFISAFLVASLVLQALSANSVFAQIKSEATYPEHSLVTAVNERDADSYVWTVLYSSSKTGLGPVVTRTCDTGREVVFTGPPGRYAVIGLALKGTKLTQDTTFIVIESAEPGPTPTPPGPTPVPPGPNPPNPIPPSPVVVPDDEWDNVGRKTAALVSALDESARSRAAATALLYSTAALKLESGELVSINQAAAWLKSERVNIWKDDTPAWSTVTAAIGEVWDKHWTARNGLTKPEVVSFYRAVTAGILASEKAKDDAIKFRRQSYKATQSVFPRPGNVLIQARLRRAA